MNGNSVYSPQPEEDNFFAYTDASTWDCNTCGREWHDPERAHVTTVNGYSVCKACVEICPVCGEYIDDGNKPYQGTAVKYRRWECDGIYSDLTHAMCAGSDVLRNMSEDASFDTEFATREEIAAVVGGAK